jgi:hypothetical protein
MAFSLGIEIDMDEGKNSDDTNPSSDPETPVRLCPL